VGSHWCWQSYKELADSDKAIECLQKAVALDGKYDYRTQYLKTQNGCYLYLVHRTHLLAHFTFASEEIMMEGSSDQLGANLSSCTNYIVECFWQICTGISLMGHPASWPR
jgi:tetratricopeptide (TPR) repeat protein